MSGRLTGDCRVCGEPAMRRFTYCGACWPHARTCQCSHCDANAMRSSDAETGAVVDRVDG